MHNKEYEEYEPTEEEWTKIEESIMREEQQEMEQAEEEDREELKLFKIWLTENEMSWDVKNAKNMNRKRI